ncbi:ATP-binding cassette domain-containing protein [Cellulomonas pakistanensis]|uniref:ABC transporter domain-containing protein n=1 Tax=Cellulomonas pakistanensis TaxID=992287 RepID=A0A919U249_9CELL|nr:ATP-binding cassette domain-containing protein [Cellulomonas pakistanensis]GIG34766.1 hypothetical protein Cpa01nite_01470 [Cellulomonas pakistanensis]
MTADEHGLAARVRRTRESFELDVALSAAPGEVVALVGPNGAGKSTALRALAGLVPGGRGPDGWVHLDGRVLEGPGVHLPPERRRCGVVLQGLHLVGHLTAVENVAFGPRAGGTPAGRARRDALGWLDRLEVAAQARTRAASLSGGQAQRVALARALAARPRLLLLDEPFAALDAAARPRVRAVLRAALAEGGAPPVLLVTHDPADAADLADRTVHLADGRQAVGGAPARVGAVVLAGGTARRIGGGDKTALEVGGRPILHRLLADLAPTPTVVVADPPEPEVMGRHPHARWVRERPPGSGPAAALAAGSAALGDVDVLVALAGDQPFAGPAVPRLLRALAEHPGTDAAVGVDGGGRSQPLLAAYRAAALRPRLARVRPGAPLRAALDGLAVRPVPLDPAEALDVDEPADLALAEHLVRDPLA